MKLYQLLQAYDFDEIMVAVNDMFPGTKKYRKPLSVAYDILTNMQPVENKKAIRYKLLKDEGRSEQYMGAEDTCFATTWQSCLGKSVTRDHGVDLSDVELAANCLVNICFLAIGPREFEPYRQQLMKG